MARESSQPSPTRSGDRGRQRESGALETIAAKLAVGFLGNGGASVGNTTVRRCHGVGDLAIVPGNIPVVDRHEGSGHEDNKHCRDKGRKAT